MAQTTTTILGNLTEEPTLQYFEKSESYKARLRIASSRRVRDKKNPELWVDTDPLFIDVDVWGPLAVNCKKSLGKGMPVLACSWMYVYPYLSGELNYTVSGLSMGMQTLKVLPQGLMIVSIPWQKLPMILTNMQKMNWHPTSESVTGEEHKQRFQEILQEIEEKIRQ